MPSAAVRLLQAIGASERVLQHLNDQPAPQIAAGQVPPGGVFRGEIELRGVWYTYDNRCGMYNQLADFTAGHDCSESTNSQLCVRHFLCTRIAQH